MIRCARLLASVAMAALAGSCAGAPGRPARDSGAARPSEVVDFAVLFADHCAGCHGSDGSGGAARGLADANYLAIADDAAIRRVIAEGVRGTAMTAFAQSEGGPLTDAQVTAIVSGIRVRWSGPIASRPAIAPYGEATPGDAARGEPLFTSYCASCHGAGGRGGVNGSAIVDRAYLPLVSDQSLRTTILVGRPDLQAPHLRDATPGTGPSPQDVSDIVAWLGAERRRLLDAGPQRARIDTGGDQ